MSRLAILGSIRFRLFLTSFAVIMSIVTALLVYFPLSHVATLNRSLESKASAYGKLLSKDTESAIAFDDRETAREVFAAAGQDSDVRSIALLQANGAPLHAFGEPLANAPVGVLSTTDAGVLLAHVPGGIRATLPVISKEGPRGVLVVELSTRSIDLETRRVQKIAVICFVVALTAAFLGAWFIGRSLARRLGELAKATSRVAAGDLSSPRVDDDGADEVGHVVAAFNAMQEKLKALIDEMRRSAEEEQARLDGLVRERTAELALRNSDMRLVLDHVEQGLFIVDAGGVVMGERSRAADVYLGEPAANATLWSYLAGDDRPLALGLEQGWEQVREDVLPIELTIEQMPKAFTRGGYSYRIEYTPILEGAVLSRALVIVSNCTSEVESARVRAAQAETLAMFERILVDRRGFLDFFGEASDIVAAIASATAVTPELRRALHTLKGNAAVMHVDSIATLCHALEEDVEQTGSLGPDHLRALGAAWNEVATKTRSFAGDGKRPERVRSEDLEAIATDIANGVSRAALVERVTRLRLDPVAPHFERLGDQATRLATSLGKSVLVSIEAHDVRLFDAPWGRWFGSLIHVVRNAIDHGIETEDERVAAGKPADGNLSLRAFDMPVELVIEIADDGRGVDWERLAERAREHGLPCATRAETCEALFCDGVSTKDEISEISGRGVGLAAVRAECIALGGRIHVESTPQLGMTIAFHFPKPTSWIVPRRVPGDSIAAAAAP